MLSIKYEFEYTIEGEKEREQKYERLLPRAAESLPLSTLDVSCITLFNRCLGSIVFGLAQSVLETACEWLMFGI